MAQQSDTTDPINGLSSLFANEGISKTRRGVTAHVRSDFVQFAALMAFTLATPRLSFLDALSGNRELLQLRIKFQASF